MTVEKFLDPKNDFAFKKIFGTEKNKGILIHFLNDMLGLTDEKRIADVQFLKPNQDPEIAVKKQSIVDVLCQDEVGCQYIVEMQVASTDSFQKRAQFYAARTYTSQLKKGELYHNLKEVIFLAITNFVMFPDKPGYRSTHVTLDSELHTRDLKDFYYSFLELPKFNKSIDELETLVDKWAYFFKHAPYTTPEELDKLSHDSVFKYAFQALNQCYWTEAELDAYESVLKYTRDEDAAFRFRLNESFNAGVVNERINIAKSLLKKNTPIELIKLATKLSEEEIQKLIEEVAPSVTN